jgi:hypothetical protein
LEEVRYIAHPIVSLLLLQITPMGLQMELLPSHEYAIDEHRSLEHG